MKKEIQIFKGFWTVSDVLQNRTTLFVFGDNDVGRGKRGQAIIRDCPNAIGIPTKKLPILKDDAFYSDAEFHDNCVKIDRAITKIERVFLESTLYDVLMFPEAGLGTGLAELDRRAPRTLEYLLVQIESLKKRVAESSRQ